MLLILIAIVVLLNDFHFVSSQGSSNGNIIVHVDQGVKKWPDAEAFCLVTYKTHLATIRSEQDNAFLDSFNQAIWIGLTDVTQESYNDRTRWRWASGEPLNSSLLLWNPTEPDGGIKENCVANEGDVGKRWADHGCDWDHYFACDVEKSDNITTTNNNNNSNGESHITNNNNTIVNCNCNNNNTNGNNNNAADDDYNDCQPNDYKISNGAIIGGAIGGALAVVMINLIAYVVYFKWKLKAALTKESNGNQNAQERRETSTESNLPRSDVFMKGQVLYTLALNDP